jgi:hypothetical protein
MTLTWQSLVNLISRSIESYQRPLRVSIDAGISICSISWFVTWSPLPIFVTNDGMRIDRAWQIRRKESEIWVIWKVFVLQFRFSGITVNPIGARSNIHQGAEICVKMDQPRVTILFQTRSLWLRTNFDWSNWHGSVTSIRRRLGHSWKPSTLSRQLPASKMSSVIDVQKLNPANDLTEAGILTLTSNGQEWNPLISLRSWPGS